MVSNAIPFEIEELHGCPFGWISSKPP
jgi:hypothetical protein